MSQPQISQPFDSDAASTAYRSALQVIEAVEPTVAGAIRSELADQRESLKLIASENYASPAMLLTMGTWLSDKYAEGTVGHRFYAACQNIDTVEQAAADHATALFGAPHAYVQPHSGIDANLVAFWAILAQRLESPGARRGRRQARQRPVRGRLAAAAPRDGQPARAGHVARRRRPPHPRLPAEHQRQDVRAGLLRHRPRDRPAGLRRRPGHGPRVQAARTDRGLLRLPAEGEFREDARHRRRGGRRADGRHGALRRPGRRQGLHRRLRPGAARPRHHHHHAQVAAGAARRHGAVPAGVRRRRRPRLPDGAGRPARSRHGGQGRRAGRGPAGLVPHLRRRRSPTTRWRWPRAWCDRGVRLVTGGTENHLVLLDVTLLRHHRPAGRVGAAGRRHRHQPQRHPPRPERRLVHLRRPARHPGAHLARFRHRTTWTGSPS